MVQDLGVGQQAVVPNTPQQRNVLGFAQPDARSALVRVT